MGRPNLIKSPEELWQYFCEYVEHAKNNPMYRVEYVGKEGREEFKPLPVPITFEGFEIYLADKNIIQDLGDYASNKNGRYKRFSTIITRIRKNCFVNNFNGAAVGLFHPNLIARKLGLTDKVEQTIIEQPLFNLDEPDGNDIDQEDSEA
jgi:hypothetical protein